MEQKAHLMPMQIFSFQILSSQKNQTPKHQTKQKTKTLLTEFWHQAQKQSEPTVEHEIRLFFIDFVVQYIQFVLQLFQIHYNFSSAQCIAHKGSHIQCELSKP